MLVILTGPSCIGKTTAIQLIIDELGFETIIPYTTRARREGQSDGRFLRHITHEEFQGIVNTFSGKYWVQPIDGDYYGYNQEDLDERVADTSRNYIIEAHSKIAFEIQRKYRKHCFLIYLDFTSQQALKTRICDRFKDEKTIELRLQHAEEEREQSHKYLYIIKNDDVKKIHERLLIVVEDCVERHQITTKTSSSSASGALLASDLKEVLADGSIKIFEGDTQSEVQKSYKDIVRENLKDDFLELSLDRFYRKSSKNYKRKFDLAEEINSLEYEKIFKSGKIPSSGIKLNPGEFIIGQTYEKIEMPNNLIALLTGRMSYALLGISIDLSAYILQPKHNNVIPLQIKNNSPFPIVIYPRTKLVQVVFIRTISESNSNNGRERKTFRGDLLSTWYEDEIYNKIQRSSKVLNNSDNLKRIINIGGDLGSLVAAIIAIIALTKGVVVLCIISAFIIFTLMIMRWFRHR
jgi:deoxycytidine triphosphate deaminase